METPLKDIQAATDIGKMKAQAYDMHREISKVMAKVREMQAEAAKLDDEITKLEHSTDV